MALSITLSYKVEPTSSVIISLYTSSPYFVVSFSPGNKRYTVPFAMKKNEKYETKCVKCNTIITQYGITYRNEPWHRRCFTCTKCKTYLSGKQFTSQDEKPYCPECFGKLLAKSSTSSKPITVGVSMKKELPEKQVKNFLEQIFSRECV